MERIKNYATALFLCLVLLLQGCLKVDEENFYNLHTGEVTLTEAGVDLNATIDKKVAQNAREFGVEYKFVYGDDDSDTWKRIACSRTLQNNDFTAHLSLSELLKNKTNQKGESLSQIKYVAYCDFSGSKEIAEERTFLISFCCLTAKPNNSSYGMVSSSGYYVSNTEVTITATPKENYYFTGWSDSDTKELTRTITITSDTTITAVFLENPYLLKVYPNNNAYGTVTGSGYYDVGTKVTITAMPKENYYFTGWSDCDSKELSRTITITSNTTITANFAKKPYLTAQPNNSGYGIVTGSGYYAVGSEATITATPKGGFVQWNDGNTENPRTVTVTSDVTYIATFKLPNIFSVAEDKQVIFSPGNLQYHPANNEWRFAENQTDYIGDANSNCSSTYNGWLDLFGWGTGNYPTKSSTSSGSYSTFVDWGTNQIGADAPNTWRTLTNAEWEYLLNTRTNASSLKGVAEVNGVNGLILLPDNWTCPEGVTFKSGFHDGWSVAYYAAYQTFTADQWSKMEQQGAVFLPAAGDRIGSDVVLLQDCGSYWSATEGGGDFAGCLHFRSDGASMGPHGRLNGRSVRLVKDL